MYTQKHPSRNGFLQWMKLCRFLILTFFFLVHRLDPALIRPGRVDYKSLIGYASKHQLHQMFIRFYPELDVCKAEEFADKATAFNRPISIAAVQGFFMLHKADGNSVLQNVEKIWSWWLVLKSINNGKGNYYNSSWIGQSCAAQRTAPTMNIHQYIVRLPISQSFAIHVLYELALFAIVTWIVTSHFA